MPRKLQIKLDETGHGSVVLDGTDISNAVRAVEMIRADPGRSLVVLELVVTEIDVTALASPEAEILVSLTDDVIRALTMLGWTPPDDDRRTYYMPRAEWVPVEDQTAEADRPAECRCYELNPSRLHTRIDTHEELCPLFVTDNASPDAND